MAAIHAENVARMFPSGGVKQLQLRHVLYIVCSPGAIHGLSIFAIHRNGIYCNKLKLRSH